MVGRFCVPPRAEDVLCQLQQAHGVPGPLERGACPCAGTRPAAGPQRDVWSLFLKHHEFEKKKSLGCNEKPIFPTIPPVMTLAH